MHASKAVNAYLPDKNWFFCIFRTPRCLLPIKICYSNRLSKCNGFCHPANFQKIAFLSSDNLILSLITTLPRGNAPGRSASRLQAISEKSPQNPLNPFPVLPPNLCLLHTYLPQPDAVFHLFGSFRTAGDFMPYTAFKGFL